VNGSSSVATRSRVGSGERVGSVDYEAHLAADRGHVRLRYTSTHAYNGEKRYSDYTISLETTPQTFGGQRWWFVCPRTAERVSKLHLPNGAYTFASRRVYRLGYWPTTEVLLHLIYATKTPAKSMAISNAPLRREGLDFAACVSQIRSLPVFCCF
jgi:hypothetical protein